MTFLRLTKPRLKTLMRLSHVAWKSTVSSKGTETTTKNSFPFHQQHAHKSTVANSEDEARSTTPSLVKVPSLPLLGSMFPPHSGIPLAYENTKVFEFWPAMREKYGDFYQWGFVGVGTGLHGTSYVLQSPHEMASILRSEGSFPFGSAQFAWPMHKFFGDRQATVMGFFGQGPAWKRVRKFVQTDLLAPESAQRYTPAILEAAAVASQGAPHLQHNLNDYLGLASMDMFSNAMMGNLPMVSHPKHITSNDDETLEQDKAFARKVANGLRCNQIMTRSLYHSVLIKLMGFKTSLYKDFEQSWDEAQEFALKRIQNLHQRFESNPDSISTNEKQSYAVNAFRRQASLDESDKETFVTPHEAKTVVAGLLSAGIDTTAGMLSWKLLHLAASPESQDKIYHELQPTLVNGKLTAESLKTPYLNAFLRESHRLANPNVPIPMKVLSKETQVHGEVLPRGSVVMLDGYSTGMRQDYFQDPVKEIAPERFLPDAVQERKGTAAQAMDHSFFNGPFSQGARKCPGSRLAKLEAHAMVAQWVLDWKLEMPSGCNHWTHVPYDQVTVTTALLPDIEFSPRS